MEKITELLNRIALGANLSNGIGDGPAYGNPAVVLAYAYLVHELAPILLAVLKAAGLA